MGKRIYFITGGFGFLGQYIVKAVYDHDSQADIRVLMRTRRKTFIPIQSLDRVQLVEGDMTRIAEFDTALDGVETVIHNAALVSFKPGDAEAIHQVNTLGTRHLLQAAVAHGCRNFIFISSVSAIGACQPGKPSDETVLPTEAQLQRDPYGRSKYAGECEVQAHAAHLRGIILNPSLIIGPGSYRIERLLRWLRYVPVFPMLPTLNSFVDVRDVARAVVLALTAGRSGERYIVTGENVDMLTFTRSVLKAMGKSAPVFPVSGNLIRVADGIIAGLDKLHLSPGMRPISAMNVDKAYSTEKIRHEMAWQPVYTLEQSLVDTLALSKR